MYLIGRVRVDSEKQGMQLFKLAQEVDGVRDVVNVLMVEEHTDDGRVVRRPPDQVNRTPGSRKRVQELPSAP